MKHDTVKEKQHGLIAMLFHMFFDRFEGFIADVMLHAAGIFGSGFLINADADQHFCEHGMPLVDPFS